VTVCDGNIGMTVMLHVTLTVTQCDGEILGWQWRFMCDSDNMGDSNNVW